MRLALRRFVEEDVAKPLVDIKQAFVDKHADGGCGDALAQRIQLVGQTTVVGCPVCLRDDPTVSQDHDLVRLGGFVRVDCIQERVDRARGDALTLRRTARQRLLLRRRQEHGLLRAVRIRIKVLGVLYQKFPDHVHRALLQREIDLLHLLAEDAALSAQLRAVHAREHLIARVDAGNHLVPRHGRHRAGIGAHLGLRRVVRKIVRNRVRHALRRVAAGEPVDAVGDQFAGDAARDDERGRSLHRGLAHDEPRADALHRKEAKRALGVKSAEQRFLRDLPQKAHGAHEAELPCERPRVLLLRPAARDEQLKVLSPLAEQRRGLKHVRQIFLMIQTARKQQRGRLRKVERLPRAGACLRAYLVELCTVVEHLDVALEAALIEERARLLADHPDLVTTVEKIEREILRELVLPLVLWVCEVFADVFRVKCADQRHAAFIRKAHGLHARGTGAVRMHDIKRMRVDTRKIMHVQHGRGRSLDLCACAKAEGDIVEDFIRQSAAVTLGHQRRDDIDLVPDGAELPRVGIDHAAHAVGNGKKRVGALRNSQHVVYSSAHILAQQTHVPPDML